MATELSKPVTRRTAKVVKGRPVLITIAPAGSQAEALIGLRLSGCRTEYIVPVSWLYVMAAMQHGQKEARAKKEARKMGIPWKTAKKQFDANNRIETYKSEKE